MARFLILLVCSAFLLPAHAEEDANPNQAKQPEPPWNPAPAFWMWRDARYPNKEALQTLAELGSTRNYLHVIDSQSWPWPNPFPQVPYDESEVPMVRLTPGAETVLKDDFWDWFRTKPWGPLPSERLGVFSHSPKEIQIDFDCPAALLPQYAARLKTLRKDLELESLSITALASWIDAPGFKALTDAVDELVPMFYDLEKDEPADVAQGKIRGMVDPSTLSWIKKWSACETPWRAGLPNFQRLTIFNPDGSLVGHLRQWSLSGLLTHPAIDALPPRTDGIQLYQVSADGSLSSSRISAKQMIAWRQPDEMLSREAIRIAKSAGARGIVWFAHPQSAPKAWHSVEHLAKLATADAPKPSLSIEVLGSGSLRLTNQGPGDLLMRPSSSPIQLILEAPAGSFGRGGPGRFLSKKAPGASLNHPDMVRRVVLEFSSLRSGDSLTTGNHFLNLTDVGELRWSIAPTP